MKCINQTLCAWKHYKTHYCNNFYFGQPVNYWGASPKEKNYRHKVTNMHIHISLQINQLVVIQSSGVVRGSNL